MSGDTLFQVSTVGFVQAFALVTEKLNSKGTGRDLESVEEFEAFPLNCCRRSFLKHISEKAIQGGSGMQHVEIWPSMFENHVQARGTFFPLLVVHLTPPT